MKRTITAILSAMLLPLIAYCQGEVYQYMEKAQKCFASGDYQCAKNYYENAKDIGEGSGQAEIGIATSRNCMDLKKTADSLFKRKDYLEAKVNYEGVLYLNKADIYCLQQKQRCEGFVQAGSSNDWDGDGVPNNLDASPMDSKKALRLGVDHSGRPVDNDHDGVPDWRDNCLGTPKEAAKMVDANGCPLDSDKDGVPDYRDDCPNTPLDPNRYVDTKGCYPDDDKDGVNNFDDRCPDTPPVDRKYIDAKTGCLLDTDGDGVPDIDDLDNRTYVLPQFVDSNGRYLDSDHDGVFDYCDSCPDTPRRFDVDEKGCPVDSDHDGVTDDQDRCPDTPQIAQEYIDPFGCPIDSDHDGIFDYQLDDALFRIETSMVFVRGGTFQMGSNDKTLPKSERPEHRVTLASFYISKFELTQELWETVMGLGNNPSENQASNFPVTNVQLADVQKFIAKLNRLSGKQYRLPSEAEWEYAAKGGSLSHRYRFSGSDNAVQVAWHSAAQNETLHPVAMLKPNELGLYDMNGNVYEWTSDIFVSYQPDIGDDSAPLKYVIRGGSFFSPETSLRLTYRQRCEPSHSDNSLGFRLAMSATSMPSNNHKTNR